jgi:hypothetical protein
VAKAAGVTRAGAPRDERTADANRGNQRDWRRDGLKALQRLDRNLHSTTALSNLIEVRGGSIAGHSRHVTDLATSLPPGRPGGG